MTEMRGVLALATLVFVFALAILEMFLFHHTPDVPTWATTTLGAVIGFYFGAHSPSAEQQQTMRDVTSHLADKLIEKEKVINGNNT